MGFAKMKIKKFDGRGDFNMWCKKMKAILVQQKCAKALNGEKKFVESMSTTNKQDLMECAYSLLILNLADNVLRQIDDEDTKAKVWLILESLYMTKTLSNKIYLKKRLFRFRIDSSKTLEENLDDFNVITIGLANIDDKISDENQAIILLNSLPESHKDLKTTIKYGHESLSLEDVLGALRSRDFEIKKDKKSSSLVGERLLVRGRPDKKSHSKGKRNSRSQSHGKGNSNTMICWFCKKEGHIHRNCPSRRKGQDNSLEKTDSANISDGYDNSEGLIIS